MPESTPTERDLERFKRLGEGYFQHQTEQARAPEYDYTFDQIPRLGPVIRNESGAIGTAPVLLSNGGLAGYTYAQIPLTELKLRVAGGWQHPVTDDKDRPIPTYTINGPKGSIDCVLVTAGAPIPGVSNDSNQRPCYIHPDIYEVTGIPNPLKPASQEIEAEDAEEIGEAEAIVPSNEFLKGLDDAS
jgi:hypothetical protein